MSFSKTFYQESHMLPELTNLLIQSGQKKKKKSGQIICEGQISDRRYRTMGASLGAQR